VTEMPGIEVCQHNGVLLAMIVRNSATSERTKFITPDDCTQQVGFVVYKGGSSIPRHEHLPIRRTIVGTTEMIFVRQGRCTAEIYDTGRALVMEVELHCGDAIMLNGGAHGFRVHEDTVLLEVKQGPFVNEPEKVRF
jgi:hypothetical protein